MFPEEAAHGGAILRARWLTLVKSVFPRSHVTPSPLAVNTQSGGANHGRGLITSSSLKASQFEQANSEIMAAVVACAGTPFAGMIFRTSSRHHNMGSSASPAPPDASVSDCPACPTH
jgi:hypothetical protein